MSEKERQVELGALFRDVASIIVEKCVNPTSQRPYTVGLIERGLKDIHFAVDPSRPAKQQVSQLHFSSTADSWVSRVLRQSALL